jgi:hypothetical protein
VGIKACVVGCPVEPNPIRSINATAIGACWTKRKCAGDFNPPVSFLTDGTDFVGHFGKVLILAKHQRDIKIPAPSHADDIERQSDIDALFLADESCMEGAAGESDGFIAVSKRAGVNVNTIATHLSGLGNPEVISERFVRRLGNAGIETSLPKLPAMCGTDHARQTCDVVVWMGVAERGLRVVKKVLAVEKGDRAFNGRLNRHIPKRITPPEALRRVERGVNKSLAMMPWVNSVAIP